MCKDMTNELEKLRVETPIIKLQEVDTSMNYTNGKYVAFIRSRSKDLNGRVYLIIGWNDGATPRICFEDDFLTEYYPIDNQR